VLTTPWGQASGPHQEHKDDGQRDDQPPAQRARIADAEQAARSAVVILLAVLAQLRHVWCYQRAAVLLGVAAAPQQRSLPLAAAGSATPPHRSISRSCTNCHAVRDVLYKYLQATTKHSTLCQIVLTCSQGRTAMGAGVVRGVIGCCECSVCCVICASLASSFEMTS
jgi:hypothetical protein